MKDALRRKALGPLAVLVRHADFRWLFMGNSISLLGSSVTTVALPLTAVVYLNASAIEMGVLGAAALMPHLVLGLPAGVWISRMPFRKTVISTDLARVALLGSVPLLYVTGMLQMWHLYVVVLLSGTANLFETVAAQSFTPLLVPRGELFAANSALMMSSSTVNTTGSALGGLLVSMLTAPVALIVDAISFLLSGLSKTRIRNRGNVAVAEESAQRHFLADIFEGWRVVFAHHLVRPVFLAATVSALAGQAQNVVIVLFLVRAVGLPPGLVGVAIAISGLAGVLSASLTTWFTTRVGPGRAFITGMLLASVSGLVLAVAAGPFPVIVCIVAISQLLRGGGPSIYGVNQQTLRQVLIPQTLLPRVNATWRFLAYGGQSLGALLGGVLGSMIGLRATLAVTSCMMLAGTAIAIASPLRSLRELPEPATSGDG